MELFVSSFLPHGYCMRWQPGLVWLHVISDAFIVLAYSSIPLLLAWVVRKRRDIPFNWMFLAFGTFILACGGTHLMGIITLWFPMYRLEGVIKAITAVASVATAISLGYLLPFLLKIPSPEQLQAEIDIRKQAEAELKRSESELAFRVAAQTQELSVANQNLERSIREERQMAALLLEREAQVQAAFDAARVGTWSLDLVTQAVTWDPQTKRLYGLPPDHPVSTREDVFHLLHPEDRELVSSRAREALENGSDYNVEYRVVHPDGSLHWLGAQGAVERARDGKPLRMVGVNIDIDSRKRAELALQETEQQFTVLADTIPQLAWMAHPDGYIFWYNRRWYEYTNTTPEQMMGWGWQAVHDPNELPRVLDEWKKSIATGRPFEMELPLRGGDGQYRWFLTRGRPIRDGNGQITRWIGTNTDITEIRQANRAKSEFLATMSHEIRTPMNAILGMSDMLAESNLDPAQAQYVEVFRRAGANLLVLLNDILDLSKIEAGHLELEQIDFDLEEVIDQTMELIGAKARAKGLTLIAHLAPDLATSLTGDPTRLRQVLLNLLGNAVKFTERGQIVLSVQNHPAGRSGEIEFSVTDTGIGIPPDRLETIFHGFTQADSSITRKYGGTGLGLEISRRLVEHMGGRLTVTSRVGQGSTFRFNAQFGISTGRERKATPEILDLRGRRVLVVDNNATNRFIVSETLTGWGLEVEEFADPEAALARLSGECAKRPFSLALMDSRMPGMDGFEAVARMKEIAPELAVVMFSSDARPGDLLRRRQAGLAGYAIKPVKRSELLRIVCQAMNLSGCNDRQPDQTEEFPAATQRLRILLAEDSADNRLLIQLYLKGTPHQLVCVEDGKAAVDCFAREDFDLVLMDMQMPVMDGLSATRAIRAIEHQHEAKYTPIIALTANARPQDAAMSTEAGCDDHLSKPISKQNLLRAIERISGQRPEPAARPEIDIPAGFEEHARAYLERQSKELEPMRALLANKNFEELRIAAHNLKGTGASFGFPDVTRIGALLETAAKEQDEATVREQLLKLSESIGRASGRLAATAR